MTIRSTGEGVDQPRRARARRHRRSADFEEVRDRVMDALGSFVDPKTGRKPVKAINKREEVFKGKHADLAPDILMEPEVGYSLTHARSAIEDADWISGDHRPEGVIVAVGPNVKPFEQPPLLIDLAPTILARGPNLTLRPSRHDAEGSFPPPRGAVRCAGRRASDATPGRAARRPARTVDGQPGRTRRSPRHRGATSIR